MKYRDEIVIFDCQYYVEFRSKPGTALMLLLLYGYVIDVKLTDVKHVLQNVTRLSEFDQRYRD